MLYLEQSPGNFAPWGGEPINAIRYPINIEQLWTAEDLATLGLYAPVNPGVPDGKVSTGQSVARVNGVVTIVHTLEDIPLPPAPTPSTSPLSNRQLRLGLIRHGIGLSAVAAAIAAIEDETARDEATVWWEYSDTIHWDHPMTQTLIGLMGIPLANAETMWMVAKDYDA